MRVGPVALITATALAVASGDGAFGQDPGPAPRLVRDISLDAEPTLTGYPWVFQFEALENGDLLFNGWDGIHGWELWKTDGTVEGTGLVRDICPGQCSSLPFGLRSHLGSVYFAAADANRGTELWRSDGTAEGTVPVADLYPGAKGSFPGTTVEMAGEVYFQASDPEHGAELWATDGTPGGLRLVADIVPGPEGSKPLSLIVVADTLYFSAREDATGREPWRSDGTAGGTSRLADLCAGPADSLWEDQEGPWPQRVFGSAGSRLVISTHDSWGCSPGVWVSDGTPEGTEQVPGLGYALVFTSHAPDGAALLSAEDAAFDSELWRTDGTVAGTTRVMDINPTGSSTPAQLGGTASAVYFSAWNGSNGTELWKTDGTAGGTQLVRDIFPGSESSLVGNYLPTGKAVGDDLFFIADDGVHGRELWVTDGTTEGTVLAEDINPGPAESQVFLDSLVFPGALPDQLVTMATNEAHGWALWESDGNPGGTQLLADLDTQSTSVPQTWYGALPIGWLAPKGATPEGVIWRVQNAERKIETWVSDGTSAGTYRVAAPCGGCDPELAIPAYPIESTGEVAFFASWDGDYPGGLSVTDGTPQGTQAVAPDADAFDLVIWTHENGSADALAAGGAGLWLSDGTPGAAVQLSGAVWSGEPTPVGETVFFSGAGELWTSDGTPEGTAQLVDINPGGAANVAGLAPLGSAGVFFWADDGAHGSEPWISDGTPTGTSLLLDLRPGPEASINNAVFATPVAVDGKVYFPADDGVQGAELWVTDGTPQGTFSLGDLHPGSEGSEPRPWIAKDGFLYFSALEPATGRELWRTDGTIAGTQRVADIHPGPGSGVVDRHPAYTVFFPGIEPIVWNDRLYFAATDGTTGLELWSTDGTPGGTLQVADLNPGPGSSSPNGFAIYADQLFFTATDGVHGYELWAIGDPPPPDVFFADGFESGDTSAWASVVP